MQLPEYAESDGEIGDNLPAHALIMRCPLRDARMSIFGKPPAEFAMPRRNQVVSNFGQ